MPNCEEFIQKLFEENPDLTDKEIIAKMKELKDNNGKRLYKTSTITSRLRQFRVEQRVPSELPVEAEKIDLDDAKKEVEEAFGRRDDKMKEVERHETGSGNKVYDGRIDHDQAREEIDKLTNNINKKPEVALPETDIVYKDIMTTMRQTNKKIDALHEEILQLKQGGLPVEDKLVDVQLRESIVGKLDALKVDESDDLNESIEQLIELNNGIKDVNPSFLDKISLDKNGSVHGKLFMHDSKWKFAKRMKPIIYGVTGIGIGGLSLFALLILLKALGLLPEWI